MLRTINWLISLTVAIVAVIIFPHNRSRDYQNYIDALSSVEVPLSINSVLFSFIIYGAAAASVSPTVAYHLFQIVSFGLFTFGLLRFMRFDLFKYLFSIILLAPVFIPLYYFVQIKMGLAIALLLMFLSRSDGKSSYLAILAVLAHLYAVTLIFFYRFIKFKGDGIKLILLCTVIFLFIVNAPSFSYEFTYLLGHQEGINPINSIFLVFCMISLAGFAAPTSGSERLSNLTLISGGLLIYLSANILQFPVLAIRSLEFFSCSILILTVRALRVKNLMFSTPLLITAVLFQGYYMYFEFGLFL